MHGMDGGSGIRPTGFRVVESNINPRAAQFSDTVLGPLESELHAFSHEFFISRVALAVIAGDVDFALSRIGGNFPAGNVTEPVFFRRGAFLLLSVQGVVIGN